MKNEFNKYGKRLTEREFVEAVASIYTSTASEKERREKETNFMIDHHLGVDYPHDKRELLHSARERAAHKFIVSPVTGVKSLVVEAGMKFGIIKKMPGLDEADIDRGAKILAKEFAREKDLATEDIIQFLGEEIAPYVKKLRTPHP